MTTQALTAAIGPTSRKLGARLAYWVPTVLLAMLMLSGGVMDAMQGPEVLAIFRGLGYPDYFAVILGTAKVLGGAAILVPVPRALREWAYAGCTFDVLGAISSLLASGHTAASLGIPYLALAIIAASYFGWRRRLASA
jgi:uncharacterized membrane protein